MEAAVEKVRLARYNGYNESGISGLGAMPSEWRLLSNRNIFKVVDKRVGKEAKNYLLLSLTLNGVIARNMETPKGKFPAEFDTYQEVKKGDFVFCLFDVEETPRGVGLSELDGMITGAYTVLRAREGYDKRFLYYFYLNLDNHKWLRPLYRGLRNTIPKESFFSFKTLVPTLKEQTAIAEFLDEKTALIDKAISIKERQIELLKERRDALINKAVTKGLNPNVKMKDSGVEWIGQIPEHWEIYRLKALIAGLESGVSVNASEAESAAEGEIGVLKTSCVYTYSFNPNENKKVFKSDLKRVACSVKAGSIIISRMNSPELVGASGYVEQDYPNLFLPDRLWQTIYNTSIRFTPVWLSIALASVKFRNSISALANGSSPSMKNISKDSLLSLRLPYPKLPEQEAIIEIVKIVNQKTDKAVSLKLLEIEKLKEYKSSLINSAVTGKIKVC